MQMDIIDKLNHGVSDPRQFLGDNSGLQKFSGHYQLLLLSEQNGEHDALTEEGRETLDVAREKLLQYYLHDELSCVRKIPIITITSTIKFSADVSLIDVYPLLDVDENFQVGLDATYRDGKNFTNIEQEKKVFNNQIKMIIKIGERKYNTKLFCRNIHVTGVKSVEEIDELSRLVFRKLQQVRENLLALREDVNREHLQKILQGQFDPTEPCQVFLNKQLQEFGNETPEEGMSPMEWIYTICQNNVVPDEFSLQDPEIVMVKRNFSLGFPIQCQYFHDRFREIPGFSPSYEKTIHNDLTITVNFPEEGKKHPSRISFTICGNGTVSAYTSYVSDENELYLWLIKLFIYSRQFYSEILEIRPDMAVDLQDDLRFPVRLFKRDQKGKMRIWEIDYKEEGDDYVMLSRHGQKDGKIQESAPTYIRTNKSGRDPWKQLILRVNAEIKKKRDSGYTPTGEFSPDYKNCQLAQDWSKIKKKDFPVWAQPKCDGIRGLAWLKDGQVQIYSRKGLVYGHLHHLREKLLPLLQKLPPGYGLDGELFVKGVPLQKLNSWVRTSKTKHPNNHRICYYIFDIICYDKLTLNERATMLMKITQNTDIIWLEFGELREIPVGSIVVLSWLSINNEEELQKIHAIITGPQYQYEGIMLRWPQGKANDRTYYKGGRNNHLAKYKTFQEMEGKIVDICGGEGKDIDLAIFTLQLPSGKLLTCRPAASDEKRRKYFLQKEKYIGRLYTFKFLGFSQDNIPLYPVGKSFRYDI